MKKNEETNDQLTVINDSLEITQNDNESKVDVKEVYPTAIKVEGQSEATDSEYFVFDQGSKTITGYSSDASAPKNIKIPNVIDGVEVLHIGNDAFSGRQLTSVQLNDNLQTIGNNAFTNNTALASIVIPKTVNSIGNQAFSSCGNLTDITIKGKNKDSIVGEPWGAYSAFVTWENYFKTNDFIYNGKNETIEKYIGTKANDHVVIPETIEHNGTKYSVKKIGGGNLYKGIFGENVESVEIKAQLTEIPSYAFTSANNLTEVTLPNSINTIGVGAFSSCRKLKTIKLPEKLENLEASAFRYCYELTDITIPDTVTTIKDYTFQGCNRLNNIKLSNNLTSIGYEAFDKCTSLTTIDIPNTVKTIGQSAFEGCSKLATITIPQSVTSIGKKAFQSCSKLEKVTISGDKDLTIGDGAFSYTYQLKNILIAGRDRGTITGEPWGAEATTIVTWKDTVQTKDFIYDPKKQAIVKYIGSEDKAKVTIPKTFEHNNQTYSVKQIGKSAFEDKRNIESVTIEADLEAISDNAFDGCRNLKDISLPNTLTSIGENAFNGCSSMRQITLPDSVKSIGASAFNGCNSLTTIKVPNGVTALEANVFAYCTSLTTINLPKNLTKIDTNAFGNCSSLKSITLPDSLQSIGYHAFNECRELKNIEIPKNVTSIGGRAFYRCSNLEEITFSGSGTLSIAHDVFYYCSNLKQIHIPERKEGSIQYAPWGADKATVNWQDIIKTKEFVFNTETKEIKKYIGTNANVVIPKIIKHDGKDYNVASISKDIFKEQDHIISVEIQANIENIPDNAFFRCTNLKKVTLPESITSIGTYAFYQCKNLKEINIPKNITKIGDSAFLSCSSLENLILPDKLEKIESNTFEWCSSLKEINIPKSVTSIGTRAFYGCSSLKKVKIPEKVISIGARAFSHCSELTFVEMLGDGPLRIGGWYNSFEYGAFDNCTKLETILLPGRVKDTVKKSPWDAPKSTQIFWKGIFKDDSEKFLYNQETNSITQYIEKGTNEKVVIPKEIVIKGKKYPVNNVAAGLFQGKQTIQKVTIEAELTSLPERIFASSSLKEAVLPKTITSIGKSAFENTKISTFTVAGNVNRIDEKAFASCPELTNFVIEDYQPTVERSLPTYSSSMLSGCNQLKDVKIGNGMNAISYGLLSNLNSLETIKLPNSIESINSRAIANNPKLKRVTIGDEYGESQIKSIYLDAFAGSFTATSNNPTKEGNEEHVIVINKARETLSSEVTRYQPWGAPDKTLIYYKGDFLSLNANVGLVSNEYARNIYITATSNATIKTITLPDQQEISVNDKKWNHTFKVMKNDTYLIKGTDGSGYTFKKEVKVEDIGKPTLTVADQVKISSKEAENIDVNQLITKIGAKVSTAEKGNQSNDVKITIDDKYIQNIKNLVKKAKVGRNGNEKSTTIEVVATSPTKLTDTKKVQISIDNTVKTYTVNFDTDGGTPEPKQQELEAGNLVSKPETPKKEGYTFAGWFNETEKKEWKFETDKTPANNLTLKAHWTVNQYNVDFNVDGGTPTPPKQTIAYHEKIQKPTQTPVKKGHTFAGWYLEEDGFTKVVRTITNRAARKWNFDQDTMPARNIQLKAHWTVNQYMVTYDSDGGYTTPEAETKPYNELLTEPKAPTKAGYTFLGWFVGNTDQKWDFKQDRMPEDGVQLKAHWSINHYTVTFDAKNDTTPTSKSVMFAAKLTQPEMPMKKGYKFIGWFVLGSDQQWDFTSGVMPADNMTLYAKWEEVAPNKGPIITAVDKEITQGDTFNPLEGVQLINSEGKVITLTEDNIVKNNVKPNIPGVYEVTYEVKDVQNKIIRKTIKVTVVEKDSGESNTPNIPENGNGNNDVSKPNHGSNESHNNGVNDNKQNNIVKADKTPNTGVGINTSLLFLSTIGSFALLLISKIFKRNSQDI